MVDTKDILGLKWSAKMEASYTSPRLILPHSTLLTICCDKRIKGIDTLVHQRSLTEKTQRDITYFI